MHVPDPDVKGRPPVTSQGGGPDARCATITAASIARQIRLPFAINVGDLPEPASHVTVDPATGCWRCSLNRDRDCYARYRGEGVHRLVYKAMVGPIPAGFQLDHVKARGCAWTDCCNPAHLEAVPPIVNWERGTSPSRLNALKQRCDSGHEYSPENTYRRPNGHRDCRACVRSRVAKYRRTTLAQRSQGDLRLAA